MASRIEPALQRLLRANPALRREVEGAIFDFLRKYDPDQPRVPAGNRDGGQWTRTGAGQSMFRLQPGTIQPLLIKPSVEPPKDPDLRSLVHLAFLDERQEENDVQPRLPMEEIHPPARPDHIRPLDPMEGLYPSAHPAEILAAPLALALYNWLSASNGPSSRAVIKFFARGFHWDSREVPFDRASAEKLDYDQVKALCGDSIDTVQSMTDDAVKEVLKNGGAALSPPQFGTAVHWQLAQTVNGLGDKNFVAEKSYIKTEEAGRKANYGEKGSIRVDVLVQPNPQTACVYDIKSGRAGLGLRRTEEIMENVYRAFGDVLYIIVTEIRPAPWRQRKK